MSHLATLWVTQVRTVGSADHVLQHLQEACMDSHDSLSSGPCERQQPGFKPGRCVACRAQAAAKQMRRDLEGRLDLMAGKVAHAARKDAKRKAQLGEALLTD